MDSPFPRIVLASNSPRRKQLLALGGWDFRVAAAEVDESPREGENPERYVARLAEAKAKAAVEARSDEVVVAADTTVVADGRFLGKPADADQAVKMLQQLRGRMHQVFTGLAVLRIADGALLADFCSTDVTMRDYSDEEIAAYVSSGDPMDKAGAYAIQHRGFNPANPLQGCYANVVGLPLCNLIRTLKKVGVSARNDVPRACQAALQYECPVFEMILEA
jgi:septum formation protein